MCDGCRKLRADLDTARDEIRFLNTRLRIAEARLAEYQAESREPVFYTLEQTANILNVSYKTVWNYVKRGTLKVFHAEGSSTVRVERNALWAFIEESEKRQSEICEC